MQSWSLAHTLENVNKSTYQGSLVPSNNFFVNIYDRTFKTQRFVKSFSRHTEKQTNLKCSWHFYYDSQHEHFGRYQKEIQPNTD